MATPIVTAKPFDKLRTALSSVYPSKKVDELFSHYEILKREARLDHFESCLVNSGKFVEAVLKCLHYRHTGEEVAAIKVDEEIRHLENAVSLNDSERMTIPRTLRAIYELRSKRGGAHNLSFDPIKMDCAFVVAAANWVIEELTRLYLINDPIEAQSLVENLIIKDIPLVEQIEDDSLVLTPGISARVLLEILLYQHYPERCPVTDLIRWSHPSHKEHNIRATLAKMKSNLLIHESSVGLKLTESGVREAETEIAKLQNSFNGLSNNRKVKTSRRRNGRKQS